MDYVIRKANLDDRQAIKRLIEASARTLSLKDYSSEQIEAAIERVFGVDTNLIMDGTYLVAESPEMLVGCGGWSKRKTLFGGDQFDDRDSSELDPRTQPAKIRAFFVHPMFTRKGIGRAILLECESQAGRAGFRSLELMSTLPGVHLYRACGYVAEDRVAYEIEDGVTIEFVPMRKELR
jgi:GNAT superfamily N-acetyltransferase